MKKKLFLSFQTKKKKIEIDFILISMESIRFLQRHINKERIDVINRGQKLNIVSISSN